MKKLFVCAMALAAFVSCSKDDVAQGPALESMNKSIQIKIENTASATRANDGKGVNAGNTTGSTGSQMASVVNVDELKILFANTAGKILMEKPLSGTASNHDGGENGVTDLPEYSYGSFTATGDAADHEKNGVYVFHNVPAAVTRVAVVRYESTDFPNGTAGLDLEDNVLELATNEQANLQRALDDIVLFDDSNLTKSTAEDNDCVEIGGIKYYIYEANVVVAPKFSRLEIDRIKCTDLGIANDDNDIATVDFDKLVLNSFTWSTYAIAEDELGELNGQYNNGQANATVENDDDRICKPTNGVWSWNIEEQAFSKMTLNMTASAKDYIVAGNDETKGGADVNLYITGLESISGNWSGTYEAENIYKMSVDFPQSALADQQGICANVTVTIVPWTVNTVKPVFGTN